MVIRILFLRRILVFVMFIHPALDGAILKDPWLDPNIDTSEMIEQNSYPLLHNYIGYCGHMESCNVNDDLKELRSTLCYKDRCPEGFKYDCMTNTVYGAMEFCAPVEECDKGKRKAAIYMQYLDKVYLRLEECPRGYYQEYPTQCLHACKDRHHDVPPNVMIHRPQTADSPGVGYCDWKNGYFNPDSTFFSLSRQHDCLHRSGYSSCPVEKDILPDGRCVEMCPEGIDRDPDDAFMCTLTVKSTVQPAVSIEEPKSDETGTKTDMDVSTATSPMQRTNRDNSHIMIPTWLIGVMVGVSAVGVVSIVVLVVFWKRLNKGRTAGKSGYQKPSPETSSNGSATPPIDKKTPSPDSSDAENPVDEEGDNVKPGSKTTNKSNIGCLQTNINGDNTTVHQQTTQHIHVYKGKEVSKLLQTKLSHEVEMEVKYPIQECRELKEPLLSGSTDNLGVGTLDPEVLGVQTSDPDETCRLKLMY